MDRRSFLAAAAALTGRSPSTPALAADGGKPVRSPTASCELLRPGVLRRQRALRAEGRPGKAAAVPLVRAR